MTEKISKIFGFCCHLFTGNHHCCGDMMKSSAFKNLNFTLITTAVVALSLYLTAICANGADARSKPAFAAKVVGHGPPVILIPGLSCSGAVWDGTIAHLKDHYECHVLTLAGFAGQPRIAAPFLETVRNELATYIRDKNLNRPVIIGHSLGGFLALWLAAHETNFTGPLVIVDSVPFLPVVFNPDATAETIKPMAEQMRAATSAGGEQFVNNSALAVKTMVTKPADFDLVMSWVKATDPVAAGNAVFDLFTQDLRGDLVKIRSPALVFGTWIAFKDYSTRETIEAGIRKQYAQLKNCKIVMTDNARHFIMLDDPKWFYRQVDGFLAGNAEK
jgi:N-formylmaleamate deformylase